MAPTPIMASQVIRPRVRMLDSMNTMTNATATKTAVQVLWLESALRQIEMLNIADPAVITYTDHS